MATPPEGPPTPPSPRWRKAGLLPSLIGGSGAIKVDCLYGSGLELFEWKGGQVSSSVLDESLQQVVVCVKNAMH